MNNFKKLLEKTMKNYEPGIECPYCGSKTVYKDGDNYVCSDCGKSWKIKDHEKLSKGK